MTDSQLEGLAREVLEGSAEARLLAAKGLLPMEPAELLPLQVRLATLSEPEVAQSAAESIVATEPKFLASLVDEGASSEAVAYFARNVAHPVVVEAILRRRDTPADLLCEMAPELDADMQEALLLRQDKIVDHPEILEFLEKNPNATAYCKRRINEYREHLLPREKRPRKTRAELEEDADAITEEELVEAIEEVREAVPAEGEADETTGVSESQIRSLPIPVRLKLTRGASKSLRGILIKDPNPMVATSVLANNALNELEVEHIANNRTVIGEVLDAVGKNRSWVRKYAIAVALVKNPRTPTGLATRLVPRLSVRDMQQLARDRNVANAVRTTAKRLYTMKRT